MRTLGLVLALVVLGCAAHQEARTPASDSASSGVRPAVKRFTAAIRSYPKSVSVTIDSVAAGGAAGLAEVAQLTNGGLAIIDGDGRLRPQLAEAVPSTENGLWKLFPDGRMETTWRIKPGAQWQGAPFTAEDLIFTARVAQDSQLTILLDRAFDLIERIEAPDARTLVVAWKKPYIEADALFSGAGSASMAPMPKHLLERPYLEDRATFTQLPYWSQEFIGTGPFKVREFAVDSYLILEASDRYVFGRPKIDEIQINFVGDFTVMVAQVLSGVVDFNLGRGLSLEQGLQARDQWKEGRLDWALTTITGLFPQFHNPTPEVVVDLRFRRALLHAIDRQQLADTLQAGLTPVAHSPISPGDPAYKDVEGQLVRYEYDPRRAAQMLEGLGYVKRPDGYLRDAAGQRLSVKIQTTIDDLREKMMLIIGNHWQQVGVAMEPVIIPRQASADRVLRAEFASFDFTRQPADLTRYHGSEAPLPENNYRGSNRTRYRNAEFDGLIDTYLTTIPLRERHEVLGRMVHHVTDQLVIMGIFFIVDPALINNRLINIHPRKTDNARYTWNAHEWDIK